MAASRFDLQQGTSTSNLVTETRHPSRVRLFLGALLLVFVVLTIVFIALYAHEKSDSGNSDGRLEIERNETSQQNLTEQNHTQQNRTQQNSSVACEDPSCVISAGGMLSSYNRGVKYNTIKVRVTKYFVHTCQLSLFLSELRREQFENGLTK